MSTLTLIILIVAILAFMPLLAWLVELLTQRNNIIEYVSRHSMMSKDRLIRAAKGEIE